MRTSVRAGAERTRLHNPRFMLVPAVVLILLGCGAEPTPRAERPFGSESASPPGAATASLSPLTPAAPRSRIPSPNPTRTTDVNPVGDLPGWKHVFMEDFNAGDVPLGAFPGPL